MKIPIDFQLHVDVPLPLSLDAASLKVLSETNAVEAVEALRLLSDRKIAR
jgi:hypothetical protein